MTRYSGAQDQPAAPLRRRHRRLRGLLAISAIVAVGWLGLGLGMRAAYSGRVLPGTQAAGIDLGGASAIDARRRLAPRSRPAAS